MIANRFTAAMTEFEFLTGETRYMEEQEARKMAMMTGLTMSSDELAYNWENQPQTHILALNRAIAAYKSNKLLEELLVNCIARLASVVSDGDDDSLGLAMQIIRLYSSVRNN